MFDKLRGRIRDWRKSRPESPHPKTNFTPKAHPGEQLEKEARITFPGITTRHLWINYGFNRKERRRLAGELRKKHSGFTPKSTRFNPISSLSYKLGIEIDKMVLKQNPKNTPARVAYTKQIVNSREKIFKVSQTNNPMYGVTQ